MCLALPVLSSSSVRILAWLVVSLCTVVSMALGCAFVGSAQLLVVFNSVVVLGFWLRQSTSVGCLTLALSLAFGYVNLPVLIGSRCCSALVFWLLGFGFGLSAWRLLAFGYVNLPVSIGSQYCSALVFWLLGFGFGLSAWRLLAFGYVNLPVSIGSQYCSALVFWLLGFGFGLSAWLSKALRQRAATTLRGRIEVASKALRRCFDDASKMHRRPFDDNSTARCALTTTHRRL
jgi:hypothetical protein